MRGASPAFVFKRRRRGLSIEGRPKINPKPHRRGIRDISANIPSPGLPANGGPGKGKRIFSRESRWGHFQRVLTPEKHPCAWCDVVQSDSRDREAAIKTSRTGTFLRVATFLQDSNSGAAWTIRPLSLPSLTVTSPNGVLTVANSRQSLRRSTSDRRTPRRGHHRNRRHRRRRRVTSR